MGYHLDRNRLIAELAEHPSDNSTLWKYVWGEEEGVPSVIAHLVDDLIAARRSRTVLVRGRYGVGKSSLARQIFYEFTKRQHQGIERRAVKGKQSNPPVGQEAKDQKGAQNCSEQTHDIEKDEGGVQEAKIGTPLPPLWLHMPTLVNGIETSAVAVVVTAITEHIYEHRCNLDVSEDKWAEFIRASNDLWSIESSPFSFKSPTQNDGGRNAQNAGSGTHIARPVLNHISAPAGVPQRNIKANTIEEFIDELLGCQNRSLYSEYDSKSKRQSDKCGDVSAPVAHRLLVVLDDLDRCEKHIPGDVIRLLLRFSNSYGVHFILASDQDILEQGVRDWMDAYGKVDDRGPIVTAHSAVEKYLQHVIDVPELDTPVPDRNALSHLEPEKLKELQRWVERVKFNKSDKTRMRLILADVFIRDILLKALHKSGTTSDYEKHSGNVEISQPPSFVSHSAIKTSRADNNSAVAGSKEDIQNVDENISKSKKSLFDSNPDANLTKGPDTFEQALKTLLVRTENNQLRFAEPYRGLAGLLTIRQFKAFLRKRLTGTYSNDSEPPHLNILHSLFPPFWELSREDPELFLRVAGAAMDARNSLIDGRLTATVAHIFITQVDALVGSNPVLTVQGIHRVWPKKVKERRLLIELLALERKFQGEDRDRITVGSSDNAIPTEAESGVNGEPDERRPKTKSLREITREFADWVEGKLGESPQGFTVTEQVSSFQDIILNLHRTGDQRALHIVVEYVEGWLDNHMNFLDSDAVASLSNLAVMINNVSGLERTCSTLFQAAIRLRGNRHPDIVLFYVEFILDVLEDPNRTKNLLPLDASQKNESLLPEGKAKLLKEVTEYLKQSENNMEGGPSKKLYCDALMMRLEIKIKEIQDGILATEDEIEIKLAQFGRQHEDAFRSVDDDHALELASRFDSLLSTFESFLQGMPLKRTTEIWLNLWDRLSPPLNSMWTLRLILANILVGRSDAKSLEERLGMRMNAGLLSDADVLHNDPARVSRIWSQSATVLTNRLSSHNKQQRVVLAFCAGALYGTTEEFTKRLASAVSELNINNLQSLEELANLLDDEAKGLLNDLSENALDPIAAGKVAMFVFDTEYHPFIITCEDFLEAAKKDGWNRGEWESRRQKWTNEAGNGGEEEK